MIALGASIIEEQDIIPDIRDILDEKASAGTGLNIEETVLFRFRVEEVIETLHGDKPTSDNMSAYHQARADYHYLAGFISRGERIVAEDVARALELLDQAMDSVNDYLGI